MVFMGCRVGRPAGVESGGVGSPAQSDFKDFIAIEDKSEAG